LKIGIVDFMPVVRRELREGARRPFNYWLRVAGAAAGVLLLCIINLGSDADLSVVGLRLFTGLHKMLLMLICAMVPAMSADCIAREKREGTLALLFLTPLTPMGVVVGKGLVQAFRAFTLWLAVLPLIVVPFLSGGVTVGDAASAVTIEFCVTLLCLAAGMLASTLATARGAAFTLASSFAVAFVCLFGGSLGLGFLWQTVAPGQPVQVTQIMRSGQSLVTGQSGGAFVFGGPMPAPVVMPAQVVFPPSIGSYTVVYGPNGPMVPVFSSVRPNGLMVYGLSSMQYLPPLVVVAPSGWSRFFSAPATRAAWLSLLLESWLATPLLFYFVLKFAARHLAREWQDKPPSLRREGWIKTFCVPLAKRRFARRMRATLEWNPIAWLQQYSWKARLSKWGLCLGLVVLECALTNGSAEDMLDAQSVIVLILAAVYTFVGVNSFLTEKKSGALELLLVSPVTPHQIIWGRVWGLWKQFLPAGLTLLCLSIYADYLGRMSNFASWQRADNGGDIWRLLTWMLPNQRGPMSFYEHYLVGNTGLKIFIAAIGFLTLPIFATYFAMRVKNLIVAAALTWAALLLCPTFAFQAHALFVDSMAGENVELLYAEVLWSNFVFAMLACFLLSHSLSRRIYSF